MRRCAPGLILGCCSTAAACPCGSTAILAAATAAPSAAAALFFIPPVHPAALLLLLRAVLLPLLLLLFFLILLPWQPQQHLQGGNGVAGRVSQQGACPRLPHTSQAWAASMGAVVPLARPGDRNCQRLRGGGQVLDSSTGGGRQWRAAEQAVGCGRTGGEQPTFSGSSACCSSSSSSPSPSPRGARLRLRSSSRVLRSWKRAVPSSAKRNR